ncbi:hypothetical protein BD626DRAFT_371953, partial [Schizophyllum amplum]
LALVGLGNLTDKDIPHRTMLTDMILLRFREKYDIMVSEIQNSLGRVSFTADAWSRGNLESYLAITAHYV